MRPEQCWKCEAQGDTVYIEAESADEAFKQLCAKIGDMARSLVTITEIDRLPDGEEYL